jgi:hypothetical protein
MLLRRTLSTSRSVCAQYAQTHVTPIIKGFNKKKHNKTSLQTQLSVFLGISDQDLQKIVHTQTIDAVKRVHLDDKIEDIMEVDLSQHLQLKFQILEFVADQLMIRIPNPVLPELLTPGLVLEYLQREKTRIQQVLDRETLVLPENVTVLTETPSKSDPRPKSKIRRMAKLEQGA